MDRGLQTDLTTQNMVSQNFQRFLCMLTLFGTGSCSGRSDCTYKTNAGNVVVRKAGYHQSWSSKPRRRWFTKADRWIDCLSFTITKWIMRWLVIGVSGDIEAYIPICILASINSLLLSCLEHEPQPFSWKLTISCHINFNITIKFRNCKSTTLRTQDIEI